MIESSYELAYNCSTDPEVIAFMDFTNWGSFAGASQQHPHSQRKSITHEIDPVQEKELNCCRQIAENYDNPFDMLVEEERGSRRMIYNNDVTIVAEFAPTCPNEILVFPKENFSHILQMNGQDRKRIIRPTLGIFPALFFYRGVTDLNIAIHQAPFKDMEDARKYYRWHMHIYPRRPKPPVDRAGAEIGFETNIIDTLPEETGDSLRGWYTEGPNPESVIKLPDGSPNDSLLKEFNKVVNNRH
jgi:galactose-1-phosphate uridylyltransferase